MGIECSAHLCTRWGWVVHHGFQHVCGHNDRLSTPPAMVRPGKGRVQAKRYQACLQGCPGAQALCVVLKECILTHHITYYYSTNAALHLGHLQWKQGESKVGATTNAA
jgi:hypothetical protein